jgi:nitrate reductase assembly molybdenum cofactor insertion protein NarJ
MRLHYAVSSRNGTHWVEMFDLDSHCPTCPRGGLMINARSRKHGQEIADALNAAYHLGTEHGKGSLVDGLGEIIGQAP